MCLLKGIFLSSTCCVPGTVLSVGDILLVNKPNAVPAQVFLPEFWADQRESPSQSPNQRVAWDLRGEFVLTFILHRKLSPKMYKPRCTFGLSIFANKRSLSCPIGPSKNVQSICQVTNIDINLFQITLDRFSVFLWLSGNETGNQIFKKRRSNFQYLIQFLQEVLAMWFLLSSKTVIQCDTDHLFRNGRYTRKIQSNRNSEPSLVRERISPRRCFGSGVDEALLDGPSELHALSSGLGITLCPLVVWPAVVQHY